MEKGVESASSKDIINNIESLLKDLDNIYSSKESVKDTKSLKGINWQLIEERFQKVYFDRLRQNNQMNYWEISQWFKEELGL